MIRNERAQFNIIPKRLKGFALIAYPDPEQPAFPVNLFPPPRLVCCCIMVKIPSEALAELHALYSRLEQDMSPWRRHCAARGLCCDFARTGHMLYVTNLEAAGMAQAGPVPAPPHAGCPYLRGKLCGAREHRALGCRLYYCDSTYEDERNALCETFLREVRAIEARCGIEHAYRPVTEADFTVLQNT